MQYSLPTFFRLFVCTLLFSALLIESTPAQAQQKERYSVLKDALYSGGLRSPSGPRNVNWINGGDRYSYMQTNEESGSMEIRAYNPESGEDVLIFSADEHNFPDSEIGRAHV